MISASPLTADGFIYVTLLIKFFQELFVYYTVMSPFYRKMYISFHVLRTHKLL